MRARPRNRSTNGGGSPDAGGDDEARLLDTGPAPAGPEPVEPEPVEPEPARPEPSAPDATADPSGDDTASIDGATGDAGGSPAAAAIDPTEGEQSWAWHAIRVSGLFLAVVIPIHFVVTIIGGDVGATTAATMFNRLRNTWWRGTEWVVLGLALAHGLLAVRAAVAGSDLGGFARRWLGRLAFAAAGLLAGTAAWILSTYA